MAQPAADTLRAELAGRVVLPGDPDWDAARGTFNLTLDQRPEAVVFAESEDDVASAIRLAAERGLRVAPQCGGHGAGALGTLAGSILLRMDRMAGVSIDPEARRARARAGAQWGDVAAAADEHALAALAGSSPDVKVVGYTLGGGMGWLARRHGLAANSVLAADVVTADGSVVRADSGSHPDLFWALRGGGGSFGVVTALEFALYPAPEIYAGVLFWPFDRAAEVLHAWREWVPSLPDEVTSLGRLLQFPPIPDLPEFLRGQSFVVVEAAFLGPTDEGEALLRPLRDLGPTMDTFATIPPSGLAAVHMDPPEPVPYAGDGALLSAFPAEAVDALVGAAGPGSASPLLSVEVRQLGGAVGRAEPGNGALAAIQAQFAWFGVGFTPAPEAGRAVGAHLDLLYEAFAPWDPGRTYMNFAERPVDATRLFGEETLRRLRDVRSTYDPDGLFLANHPVTRTD